jgi:hypothetical protein
LLGTVFNIRTKRFGVLAATFLKSNAGRPTELAACYFRAHDNVAGAIRILRIPFNIKFSPRTSAIVSAIPIIVTTSGPLMQ